MIAPEITTLRLRNAALAIGSKGLRVFPCLERAKEPAIYDNLKRATTDANLISGWWQTRQFNIGIATGEGSGIWVLDIDGDEGEATLRSLEAEHSALPVTVEAITGKGRHLYWRWPSGREIRNRQVSLEFPGIDVRGNGGYVLAPPSVHPSGRIYAWSVDSHDDFEDAPDWLLEQIVKTNTSSNAKPLTAEQWQTFIDQSVDGSRRGPSIARLYGLLARRYVDPALALGIVHLFNELRCSPPLESQEVVKIALEIARREAGQVRKRS
jgi:hypothetical protein